MRVLPVLISFIFLSLGFVQVNAIWADDGKRSNSDSPVTRVIWGSDDKSDNSQIIPGPTYHVMLSDPALSDARAQNLIHSLHANYTILRRTDPTQMSPNQLDGADIPDHYQARYTGGSQPNAVAPTETTVFERTTTSGLGSSPFRSYRLGRLGRSNTFTFGSPNLAGSQVPSVGFGGSSIYPGSSFCISGTVRTPRFGAAGKG